MASCATGRTPSESQTFEVPPLSLPPRTLLVKGIGPPSLISVQPPCQRIFPNYAPDRPSHYLPTWKYRRKAQLNAWPPLRILFDGQKTNACDELWSQKSNCHLNYYRSPISKHQAFLNVRIKMIMMNLSPLMKLYFPGSCSQWSLHRVTDTPPLQPPPLSSKDGQ